MKGSAVLFTMVALMLSPNLFAQDKSINSQVEAVAREVLKAYKIRDLELLKKNASGMTKMIISSAKDDYFNNKDIQDDLKAIENWDGKIRGIGYETKDIMGKKMTMADVYYSDAKDTSEIYDVLLSSFDNKKWLFVGTGIGKEKREEFNKLSKTLSLNDNEQKVATPKIYSIEMANGETFNNVSQEKLLSCFNKLNDDNFFIILNRGKDFLQAAYSEKGYTVEYKESGVQYTAKNLLSKEKTVQLFKDYYQGKTNWEKGTVWEKNK